MADRTLKIALVGAGMFGGDVHLRAFADLQRSGLAPYLGRLGLDEYSRPLADVKFELVAVATRSEASAKRAVAEYHRLLGSSDPGSVDNPKSKRPDPGTGPALRAPARNPNSYHGDAPWEQVLRDHPELNVMAVATPDHLHTAPVLAAVNRGCHVVVEKPMCLDMEEADRIIAAARANNRVVCVDMHKRFDPDHLRIHHDIKHRIGEPLYGRAILEEPLEVSTSIFKWAEQSDPFSYVGPHWTDLFHHYYNAKPVGLTAVGQKKRLVRDGINAYDAVQVRVDWDNGMSIYFQNNWINPPDFEGPVNQEHEIVGTDGKVESDQQYRGFRFWTNGGGSRTSNNHFTRDVPRPDGTRAYIGYGTDSIYVGLMAACRVQFLGASLEEVSPSFPTPESGRITVAIVHAARLVRDRNFEYQRQGKAPAVSAGFGPDGITIIDPYRVSGGPEAVFERIYTKAI